jgi:hypothetical protein
MLASVFGFTPSQLITVMGGYGDASAGLCHDPEAIAKAIKVLWFLRSDLPYHR